MFKSDTEKAQTRLNSLFGEETFLSFREDLRTLYIKHRDLGNVPEWKKSEWMHLGRRGVEETRRRYISFDTHLTLFNLFSAAVAAGIGYGVNRVANVLGVPSTPSLVIGIVVSLLLYLLNTGLVLSKALISEIVYPPDQMHPRLNSNDLRFRAGWNNGVVQSGLSMMGIIIYATITNPGSKGYNLGLRFIELWLKLKFH